MKFCSECGKEIALLELKEIEIVEGRIYCNPCFKALEEEDLLAE